jgi:hypothetical protein
MTRLARTAPPGRHAAPVRALPLSLALACAPILYEVDDGGSTAAATDDPTPTGTSPSDPVTPFPTDPPDAGCGDGAWNGDESDVDCGGACPPCGPGAMCRDAVDCLGGACVQGFCGAPQCVGDDDCAFDGGPSGCLSGRCEGGLCVGAPIREGEFCEDLDPCTTGEVCAQGSCVGKTVDCSVYDGPCRVGFCNPQSGNCAVEFAAEGEPCDDDCSVGAFCSVGECVGGQPLPGPPLLREFQMPGGWTFDSPWAFGPAAASMCAEAGADDPALDHSPGQDESLAGVEIGDCVPAKVIDGPACLTSPPLQAALFPEGLWLRYWSVLSVGEPPMSASVEVFDGMTWQPLEVHLGFSAEKEWTEHLLDLTPFMSEALQVRFCYATGEVVPSPPVGGWSVDDVTVGPPSCIP